MTFHHIISEDDQKHMCPYCGKNHKSKRWLSNFDNASMYKELKCECGKKVSIKMPFMGSGDDSWAKNLDKLVEEEEED